MASCFLARWVRLCLVALVLWVSGTGCASSASEDVAGASFGSHVEIPIRPNRAGAPLVPVRGRTNVAWEMMLDTGAPGVVVSPAVAQREGWPVRRGEMCSVDALGNKRDVGVAQAKLLRVGKGGASFRSFDAMVMTPQALRFGSATGDGALGLMLFHDVLLTVDFPRNKLVIEQGALPEPNGRDVLPMRTDDAGHALVPLRFGSREVWALIDTGFSSGLAMPADDARLLPGAGQTVTGDLVTTWHGTVRARSARLTDTLRLGQYSIRRPVVDIGISQDVVLGVQYLRHFAITVDQRHGRVRFARASTAPIEVGPVRRPGFTIDPETQRVTDVIPRSGAALAGLKVGERVLRIGVRPGNERRPTAGASAQTELQLDAYADPGESFAAAAAAEEALPYEIAVEVLRNGRREIVDVPVTTLLP